MSSCFLSRLNPRLFLTVCAISFGSCFQYGLHFGIFHTRSPLYQLFESEVDYKSWPLTRAEVSETVAVWFVPLFIYGAICGALLIGRFADTLGRKGALLYNNLFLFVAVFLIGFANPNGSYKMLLAGRFFSGLNIGLNSGLVPIYLIEISPLKWRGLIGSTFPLSIAVGNLLGQILIQDFAFRFHKTTLWLFVFVIIPAVFQLTVLPWCPESPKFLLLQKVNREPEVLKGLQWLREQDSNLINTEVMEISLESDTNEKFSYEMIFLNSAMRMPLLIGCILMIVQYVCGWEALLLYSSDVFRWAKFDNGIGMTVIGAVNCFSTILTMFLIEYKGRKKLLFGGLVGMAMNLVFLFAGLYSSAESPSEVLEDRQSVLAVLRLFFCLFFIGLYSLSMGTIPGFFIAEISNQKARATTVSIAVTLGWLTFWILSSSGILLKLILNGIGVYIFLIYFAILSLAATFVWFKVPETKRLSSEEISHEFRLQAGLKEDVVATLV